MLLRAERSEALGSTAYNQFNRWRKNGTFDAILERLQIRLDEDGRIDWNLWMAAVSGLMRRPLEPGKEEASEEPDDHALGRSRGGFGTKIHVVSDGEGTPLAVHVTAGQVHGAKGFESVLARHNLVGPVDYV